MDAIVMDDVMGWNVSTRLIIAPVMQHPAIETGGGAVGPQMTFSDQTDAAFADIRDDVIGDSNHVPIVAHKHRIPAHGVKPTIVHHAVCGPIKKHRILPADCPIA
jgi:hypothetical protein